jgi:2-oxoglutarate dehydrogenase E2 component (dihydrolipoamide succinyltransferase)
MSVEIRVPNLGESVTEATVARWFKSVGEEVAADEPIVELETDKVTLEHRAPASGTLAEILVEEGGEVEVGALLGSIDDAGAGARAEARPTPEAPAKPAKPEAAKGDGEAETGRGDGAAGLAPSVRKLLEEHGLDPDEITPSGPKGNLTKGDVLAAIEAMREDKAGPAAAPKREPAERVERARETATTPDRPAPSARAAVQETEARPQARADRAPSPRPEPSRPAGAREERVRMTRLRRRIAERLKEAQNTAAMLTTYNEADMSAVMELRKRYREVFEKRHGVRLGFMSFFVKASVNALQAFPAVNAEIEGEEIVYKHYYDIGVAVGTETGLVVPVVRDADRKAFAELEREITELGLRARDGKLAMEELVGGTFTISNGGVYGSLMSSPILNPPQVGILGMHKIQERPVVIDGQIVARPMMYLALSYDHRIVDGREAVSFLVRIKECLEDPERLLLDI